MTSNNITLAISSSAGRQRLQVERTCRASALKTKIRDILQLKEDFKVMRDNGRGRPGTEEIKLLGMTSVLSMGLKNGDVIHVFPLTGTRFHDPQEGSSQNGAVSSANSKKLASTSSTDLKATINSGNNQENGRIYQSMGL